MIELFPDIPSFIRKITEYWIGRVKEQSNPMVALQMLKDCREKMPTEEAKEYFDFACECQLFDFKYKK